MEIQTFKASKNFVWADKICVDRCYVSVDFKVVSGVLIWRPVPTKMIAIAALKAIPMGCKGFRDRYDGYSTCPLC